MIFIEYISENEINKLRTSVLPICACNPSIRLCVCVCLSLRQDQPGIHGEVS